MGLAARADDVIEQPGKPSSIERQRVILECGQAEDGSTIAHLRFWHEESGRIDPIGLGLH
ncbi:MAG TPA: hypothetical protein VER33_09965 [Polyangiaceae bacterium]|nr:hypothetical protein [Polyangiaceae bacterium]